MSGGGRGFSGGEEATGSGGRGHGDSGGGDANVFVGGDANGASGGGETSGVGGRGCGASGGREAGGSSRRGRGAKGGRLRRTCRDEGDNSGTDTHLAHWDDQGRRIFPLGVDADPRLHRGRGYSPGGFGLYPSKPIVIRIVGDEVVSPPAKRNILAIMHMFWPPGCVTAREIDIKSPGFWKKCLDEFLVGVLLLEKFPE
ncbi:hypothetical protein POM88_036469 [Heracleum sosnowskyi]|uniref:Uncharacterized protein n=1 Tax=Heracleum sosnowskyi TaxID=360622 RepID=A0AAD8HQ89_9APIA|nr:hypothetical protein POM88_036469 [Heracleum sosnowskyi]